MAVVHYLRRLKDGGVYTFTSGIYGVPNLAHPAETYDDLLRLRDFHMSLVTRGLVNASLVFPLSALPGTPWFRQVESNPAFEFDQEHWIGYSIFVPQVYPKELGARRLWREILETHRALNEVQDSLPWFSAFPNCLSPRGVTSHEARQRAAAALRPAGLGGLLGEPPLLCAAPGADSPGAETSSLSPRR